MFSIILAALINLAPGINNIGQSGEVVAVNAATADATATVNLQTVSTFTTYTNIVDEVVSYEPAWNLLYQDSVFAPTNTTEDFRFEVVQQVNTWETLRQLVLTTTCISDGQKKIRTGKPGLMCYTSTGEIVTPTTYSKVLLTVSIPGDSKTIQVVNVATQDAQGWPNDTTYTFFRINYGDSNIDHLTLPVGTIISSMVNLSGINAVGSFDAVQLVTTNVIGRVDYDAFKDDSGKSLIIGEPQRFDMAITNEVVTGQAIANVYTATNDLATVTTENHFGTVTTNGYLTGEAIIVTGAAEGDRVQILTK